MLKNEDIKEVAQTTPTSKVVFEALSKRVRFRDQTDLNKFRNDLLGEGQKIVDDEYMETFKKLQQLGVGILKLGRGNKPNRFKWNYNLKQVAKAAFDESQEVNELNSKPISRRMKKRLIRRGIKPTNVIKRPGKGPVSITVSLPVKKAERLLTFISKLDN